jgi:hypothetical protein
VIYGQKSFITLARGGDVIKLHFLVRHWRRSIIRLRVFWSKNIGAKNFLGKNILGNYLLGKNLLGKNILGKSHLGKKHFGPNPLGTKTFWANHLGPKTFWPKIFWAFGQKHFGQKMIWQNRLVNNPTLIYAILNTSWGYPALPGSRN